MKIDKDYLRTSIFGFEDALVSTTGVVVGISTGIANKEFILLAASVTIAVEAISMTAGQFISERAFHQIDRARRHHDNLAVGAFIMFLSYLIGGIIPVLPLFFMNLPEAIIFVLIFAFLGLFTLGYVKGKIVKVSPTRSAMETIFIGGAATIIGVIAGYFLKI